MPSPTRSPARAEAEALLRDGAFDRGWEQLDACLRRDEPAGGAPRWDGRPFPGRTLLVRGGGEAGTLLLFARFAARAKARGGTLLLTAPAPWAEVLATADGLDRVVAEGDPLPPFDLQCPLEALPWLTREGGTPIPAEVPYLRAPGDGDAALEAPEGFLRIGLDLEDPAALAALRPLAELPQTVFFGLGASLPPEAAFPGLRPLPPDRATPAGLARALGGLDLVIAGDTLAARLAGALGRPAFLLLPREADWCWGSDGPDCPWFPSLRLYRQPRPGDWASPAGRLRSDLAGDEEAVPAEEGPDGPGRAGGRTLRIRHSQVLLKKGPGRTVHPMEVKVRIGDLVALMICATARKRLEGCRIVFQLLEPSHRSLRADLLFRDVLDEVSTEDPPDYGLGHPEFGEIYDPGPLWIAATHHHRLYGSRVLPTLRFDEAEYHGPELPWGRYVVFHPLFDPPYNLPRGMSDAFVRALCEGLRAVAGDRAVVITDQPGRIPPGLRVVASTSLYDLAYVVGHARAFIGGDTGFTHLAAAARVPHLFALYGKHFGRDFATASREQCFSDLVHPLASVWQYWGTGADTRPKVDPAATRMRFQILEGNRLPDARLQALLAEVADLLAAGS